MQNEVYKILAQIPVGDPPINLAIDGHRGHWLYVASRDRLVRINTISNEIEWEQSLPSTIITDLAISRLGEYAIAVDFNDAAFRLTYAQETETRRETEPNESLADASVLRGFGIGWLSPEESGEITVPWRGADPTPDDLEDLWQLEPRLAINVWW